MKIIMRIALTIVILIMGFAAGFPLGQNRGFSAGSEWAFVQANIFAREAGLFMPVSYEAGQFRIVLKQPKHLYKSSWILADRHEIAYQSMDDEARTEGARLTQQASLPR